MLKKVKVKRILIILSFSLIFNSFLLGDTCESKMTGSLATVKLTLENEPKIGEFAVLRLSVIAPENLDLRQANIDCFLTQELELLNEGNYTISFERLGSSWKKRVIFYFGQMKRGEKKEFIFKVRIPDGKKYQISAGINEILEIDLGDPEPPEWKPELQEWISTIELKEHIRTRIKQLRGAASTELTIPKDSLPPLRTEFKIRTKYKPELAMEYGTNPKGPIPFRYLVYTENESPKVETRCILLSEFEMVDAKDYKIFQDNEGNTTVLLYEGPMRFKECKAFYFKVKPKKGTVIKDGGYDIKAETTLTLSGDERLTKTDAQSIHFGKVLY